jgi:hypothetical protein
MILDIEKGSEGDWFSFFESSVNEKGEVVYTDPKPDAGRVRIRSIAPFIEERQAQRKRKYEFVLNPATRSMERVGYYEDQTPEQAKKDRDDIWDYAIVDIENFTDGKGKPILSTRENKSKLMALPVFDRFIGRCLQLIASAGAQAKEDETKN